MIVTLKEMPMDTHIRINGRAVYGWTYVDFAQGHVSFTRYDTRSFVPEVYIDTGIITIWQIIANRYAQELRPTTFKQISLDQLVTRLVVGRLEV